jgi:hypothetical protein
MSARVRIQLSFVMAFDGHVPEMARDLTVAFEGALRGLYPAAPGETIAGNIEPGGRVQETRIWGTPPKKGKKR